MIHVVHLINDPAVGGVNRTLEELMARLDPRFKQSRVWATPHMNDPQNLEADIIIVHFTASWRRLLWLQALRCRNKTAKLILVEHSYTRCFERLHISHRTRFRTMLRFAYGIMDCVVAVSRAQGEWLLEAGCVNEAKLKVINPHTDLSRLRLLPPPRSAGPLLLCAYGRYAPQKGFDTLIDAMRLVPGEVARLRLVGLGPDKEKLETQAAGLHHVTVDGPVSKPDFLLGAADAVVIPSRFEAFGNVGLESRAAARPIIVTNVDGLADQALPMPELTVPPEDPTALAGAINWLAAQDITSLGLSARGSVFGAEKHTIDSWNNLLADLSERRPGGVVRRSHRLREAAA
jgi:glycosyltransferase involved in cell wall biosynthesis